MRVSSCGSPSVWLSVAVSSACSSAVAQQVIEWACSRCCWRMCEWRSLAGPADRTSPLCFWTREQQHLLSRVAVTPQMLGFITCLDLSSLKRAFGSVFFPRTAEPLTNLTGSSGNLGLVFCFLSTYFQTSSQQTCRDDEVCRCEWPVQAPPAESSASLLEPFALHWSL